MLTFGLITLYLLGCFVAADWGYRYGQRKVYAEIITHLKRGKTDVGSA